MKLIFSKTALLNAVNIVLKAVPSKTTMPILTCILIDASGSDIRLTGNDTELGIETKAEGTIAERGRVALEARLFSEIIRKTSEDEDIIITADENLSVTIANGKSQFHIQSRDPEEYTYIPHIDRSRYICVSEFTLKEMIRQTIFSISSNDSNKLMSGERLTANGDKLTLVSLDGHRLSLRNVQMKEAYATITAVIPGKNLNELSRILGDDITSDVLIFFDDSHAMFEFSDTVVVTRLIDGEYFRVEQMISRDYETRVVVNRKDLLAEIDRASILVRESDKKPVIFRISDDSMEIRLRSAFGNMQTELPIQKTGADLVIGFNPTFFMDALRNIDDEEISLYMINQKSPCFIRDEEENYIYLILPVNFNQEDI